VSGQYSHTISSSNLGIFHVDLEGWLESCRVVVLLAVWDFEENTIIQSYGVYYTYSLVNDLIKQ